MYPQTFHFAQALEIFKYSDIHKDGNLAFKPAISEFSDPLTMDRKIKQMKKMYPDLFEYSQPNPPPPRGKHAGVNITRHSQPGIMIYCKKYPIFWYYKR